MGQRRRFEAWPMQRPMFSSGEKAGAYNRPLQNMLV
jgi:hypothetical protein